MYSQNKKPKKFLLKLFYTSGETRCIKRTNHRRLSAFLQGVKNSEIAKYFIRITYPEIIDNFDKKIIPTNEGEYKTKKELFHAIRCFSEI